jgi:hypothetical protein
MVMGVITCVMRVEASKRRGIVVMAVHMFMVTVPEFSMVNDKDSRSSVRLGQPPGRNQCAQQHHQCNSNG